MKGPLKSSISWWCDPVRETRIDMSHWDWEVWTTFDPYWGGGSMQACIHVPVTGRGMCKEIGGQHQLSSYIAVHLWLLSHGRSRNLEFALGSVCLPLTYMLWIRTQVSCLHFKRVTNVTVSSTPKVSLGGWKREDEVQNGTVIFSFQLYTEQVDSPCRQDIAWDNRVKGILASEPGNRCGIVLVRDWMYHLSIRLSHGSWLLQVCVPRSCSF